MPLRKPRTMHSVARILPNIRKSAEDDGYQVRTVFQAGKERNPNCTNLTWGLPVPLISCNEIPLGRMGNSANWLMLAEGVQSFTASLCTF